MLTNSRIKGRDGQAGAAPKPKDGRDRKVHIFHSAANPFFLFHLQIEIFIGLQILFFCSCKSRFSLGCKSFFLLANRDDILAAGPSIESRDEFRAVLSKQEWR